MITASLFRSFFCGLASLGGWWVGMAFETLDHHFIRVGLIVVAGICVGAVYSALYIGGILPDARREKRSVRMRRDLVVFTMLFAIGICCAKISLAEAIVGEWSAAEQPAQSGRLIVTRSCMSIERDRMVLAEYKYSLNTWKIPPVLSQEVARGPEGGGRVYTSTISFYDDKLRIAADWYHRISR